MGGACLYSKRHLHCGDTGKLLQHKQGFGKLKLVRITLSFPLVWVYLYFHYNSVLSAIPLWTHNT